MHTSYYQEVPSVSALADLAMRVSGASGYALYAADPESGAFIVEFHAGVPVPTPRELTLTQSRPAPGVPNVISYSLRLEESLIGRLTFAFRDDSIPEERIQLLDRLARIIESLYALPHSATRLFERVNQIEAELTVGKVVARAQGMLTTNGSEDILGRIQQIEEHVEKAARTWRLRPLLAELLQDAEEELSNRKLTIQAKNVLQAAYGMSEEDAYHRLRNASRHMRRPVAEIARNVLARAQKKSEGAGHPA
jgi:hypothetical protein